MSLSEYSLSLTIPIHTEALARCRDGANKTGNRVNGDNIFDNSTSCGAATRAKPRARLCEPWVTLWQL